VHCHVFNALDLPMNQFIDQTRLHAPIDMPLWVIVAILVGGLSGSALPAEAEATLLNGPDGPPVEPPPARDTVAAVRALAGPPGQHVAADPAPGGSQSGRVFAAPPDGAQDLLRQAATEAGQPPKPAGAPLTEDDHTAIAAHIDNEPALVRLVNWANAFSANRSTLIDRLLTQFDTQDQVMATPAFIDYNRWLGIAPDSPTERAMSSLQAQLDVMAAIARRRARDPVRPRPVFSFAPFDPWRFLEDEPGGHDILTLARPYIEGGSVIGFKIYPPMGFAPVGNDQRPISDFPQALCRLARDPGAALDQAMRKLFAFCVELDVPLMAHCANSNFPNQAVDAHFAGPEYWQPVLQDYPALRLNLGHFGGVWDFGAASAADASPDDAVAQALAHNWSSFIATMMADHEHLYADIAFASNLLADPRNPELVAGKAWLRDLLSTHPTLSERLMYGSDWEMVGQAEFGGNYARSWVWGRPGRRISGSPGSSPRMVSRLIYWPPSTPTPRPLHKPWRALPPSPRAAERTEGDPLQPCVFSTRH
jgi:hypothetical protein